MVPESPQAATLYGFEAGARAALRVLHQRLDFDLWMVTRTEGPDWIVLHAEDHGYGVGDNTVFQWADSFCSRMVAGSGPRIAPNSASVPAYAEAAIGQMVKIQAYIGVPLRMSDGSLFGTLCGIHPTPHSEEITKELPLIELLADLLSSLLNTELAATAAMRRAELAESDATTDSLTGLYNRRAWDSFLEAEDARCRRYGHPACVMAIDLDGLKQVNDSLGHPSGDELIRRAGSAIRRATRTSDVAARVGGDEFAVLGVECNREKSCALLNRIRDVLADAGVAASVGLATHQPGRRLQTCWELADQAMYVEKMKNKARRIVPKLVPNHDHASWLIKS